MSNIFLKSGKLALEVVGKRLELQVLHCQAGFYIGTADEYGPCSRESEEYFKTRELAESAMSKNDWSQMEMDLPREFHPQANRVGRIKI